MKAKRKTKSQIWKDILRKPLSPPEPAFVPFHLTEDDGAPIMSDIVWHSAVKDVWNAPNAYSEIASLYEMACSNTDIWRHYRNFSGTVLQTEKFKQIDPITSASELVKLALDAASFVQMLSKKRPELCRQVARNLAVWPVIADMTETGWRNKSQRHLDDLGLGAGIAGFIRSARTADVNVIRRYATGIYDTLFQTRCMFKDANGKNRTREGCPPWAAKTLSLPPFAKDNIRDWGRLGEEMLLEQRPHFLADQELKQQAYKWKMRAKNRASERTDEVSPRLILRQAFDDFRKELKKLAPAEILCNW